LMKVSLVGEVRGEKKQQADAASIATFETNLRELLLASPAGMKPTLGVDPGFRTGCKVAALDHTGKLLEYQTIVPHASAGERERGARTPAGRCTRDDRLLLTDRSHTCLPHNKVAPSASVFSS